jgi:RNA polymerase sigma-70 factor, ECF subfamily
VAANFESMSDEELARRTQDGSLDAFEALVYRYEGRLYAFVVHCCRNDADAREVTQDSFVRAFQAISQCNCCRGFAPWLFTIARRKCIDRLRSSKLVVSDDLARDAVDEVDPAELLARQEDQEDLWRLAREVLPDAQFQALWLRYAEDMSVAGIAQVLAKTQTHVKVLLFRARETLGRRLKATRAAGLPGRPPVVGCGVAFTRAVAQCAAGAAKKGLI